MIFPFSYRHIGYNLNVMRQSAFLVFNPIMVDNYAAFLNCRPGVRLYDGTDIKLFILVAWDLSFLSVAWPSGVQSTGVSFFFCSGFQLVIRRPGISIERQLTESVSPRF